MLNGVDIVREQGECSESCRSGGRGVEGVGGGTAGVFTLARSLRWSTWSDS